MNVGSLGKVYDCVVVGSGAGGGTLLAHLASKGADVLVLEGGPKINTRTDFNTHALPYEFLVLPHACVNLVRGPQRYPLRR